MEPNALSAQPKLPNFTGKKGSSPTFQEYQLKLIALCREKFIHEALLPIGEELNAAKTLIYQKADNGVYNAIITSISGAGHLSLPLNISQSKRIPHLMRISVRNCIKD